MVDENGKIVRAKPISGVLRVGAFVSAGALLGYGIHKVTKMNPYASVIIGVMSLTAIGLYADQYYWNKAMEEATNDNQDGKE